MPNPSFRRFIEESNDALAKIDGHGRVLFANRHWRQLVAGGDPNDEPTARLDSVGTWPNIPEALLRVQSDEFSFLTALPDRGLPLTGTLVKLAASNEPKNARLLCRIRPLHAGLAPTRDRFFTLIEQFPFAIGVHRDQRFLYVNQAALRYLGYDSKDELVGQLITSIVAPDELAVVRQRVGHMMRTGQPLPERETKMLRRDGAIVLADLSAFMIRDEDGLPSYVVVSRDITERRVLEEKLRHDQRMEAVGRLAGGIAHDFNNVLAVVLSYAELLQIEGGTQDVPGAAREIERAAERAASLVRELLTFSRGHVADSKLQNVNELVEGLREFLQRSIGARIRLALDLEPSLPPVRAGASHLEQILVNLAVNGRDAMPEGGELGVRTRVLELVGAGDDESIERDRARALGIDPGTYVVLEVRDTGRGMSPEVARRAFEPFFTTKGPGRGTGLGLATVYGIARQAGGAAEAESAPGRGTTMRIYLPVAQPEAAEPPAPPKPKAPTRAARVMLVEDDEAVRVLVSRVLKQQGFEVLEARDGQTALRLQEQIDARGDRLPELLLSDVVMPDLSGPELARKLRQTQPGLRLVFMSGYADDNLDSGELAELGARFVQKPFTTRDLVEALSQALDRPRP